MSDLVDHHRDQSILGTCRIRPILFWPWTIETNHRVFHTTDWTIDADSDWIGIVECVSTVHIECVDDCVSAVFAPKRFGLVWIVTHGHDAVAIHIVPLSIPNKFATGCKSKISNVFGMEDPSLRLVRLAFFVRFGFLGRHDKHRLFSFFCSGQSFLLS